MKTEQELQRKEKSLSFYVDKGRIFFKTLLLEPLHTCQIHLSKTVYRFINSI